MARRVISTVDRLVVALEKLLCVPLAVADFDMPTRIDLELPRA
jgi:hypothetical protein